MNDQAKTGCPRVEDISAFVDGALTGDAGRAMTLHAAQCPACGSLLREFISLRAELETLHDVRCDVDIAALVLPRLKKRAAPKRKAPRRWADLWQLGPRALGGAAALGIGAYLGLTLVAGGGVALRPAGMTVFYGEQPGVYCAGLPLCSSRAR
jgi:anti-sigma factor RsiW